MWNYDPSIIIPPVSEFNSMIKIPQHVSLFNKKNQLNTPAFKMKVINSCIIDKELLR